MRGSPSPTSYRDHAISASTAPIEGALHRKGTVMPELPKRQLGRTGLDVTMLGYGAMELRGVPRGRDVSDAQAETILHAVLDAGINYIDTSIDYGVREERIGRYIGDRRAE